MAYYRVYFMNPTSGHIDRAEDIEAADDVAAVAAVREIDRSGPVELWHEQRMVLRLDGSANIPQPGEPLAS